MDNNLTEYYKYFTDFWNEASYILPPKADTISNLNPLTNDLSRDELGIVGQLQEGNHIDSGDSAHRTGVLSFCNSNSDMNLLPQFENDGIMVRHPKQVPWNNWKNCSRDQLTGYISGCWRSNQTQIVQRLLEKHRDRNYFCQNTEADYEGTIKDFPHNLGDPLGPHDRMFFKICSGDNDSYKDNFAQFALHIAIEVMSKDVTVEKNQLLLQSIVCGRLNLFTKVHTNYRESLLDYWAGWRKQRQIAEALISVVEIEMERYNGLPSPPVFFG